MEPEGAYTEADLYTTNGVWLVETTGDFDGNTAQDILWRNSKTQEVAITNMGTDRSFIETDLYVTSSIWDIESAADFDADGSEDILWRSNPTTGTLSEIGISYMINGLEDNYKTIETINK